MSTIKTKAKDMGTLIEAESVCEKFQKAFTNFSKCHKGYSGGAIEDEAISQLGGYYLEYEL